MLETFKILARKLSLVPENWKRAVLLVKPIKKNVHLARFLEANRIFLEANKELMLGPNFTTALVSHKPF